MVRFLGGILKALVVTDLHDKKESIENLSLFLGRSYDVLLVLGDVTQFGPASNVEKVFDLVDGFDLSAYFIPGNCDPPEVKDLF